MPELLDRYGTEVLSGWRWRHGFVYPECGHAEGYGRVQTRGLLQCRHCHHQTSVTAGSVFPHSKLPLTTWFLAMYLLTRQKNGISALEFKRHLGVSYPTAWMVKHKLPQTMLERNTERRPSGVIELDEVYWRGSGTARPPVAARPTRPSSLPLSPRIWKDTPSPCA